MNERKKAVIYLVSAMVVGIVILGSIGFFIFSGKNTHSDIDDISLSKFWVGNDRWNTTILWVKFDGNNANHVLDNYNIYVYDSSKKLVSTQFDYCSNDSGIGIVLHKSVNFVGTYYVGFGGAWNQEKRDYPFSDLYKHYKIEFEKPHLTIVNWWDSEHSVNGEIYFSSITFEVHLDSKSYFYYNHISWRVGDTSEGIIEYDHVRAIKPDSTITLYIYIGKYFYAGMYPVGFTLGGCNFELENGLGINLS